MIYAYNLSFYLHLKSVGIDVSKHEIFDILIKLGDIVNQLDEIDDIQSENIELSADNEIDDIQSENVELITDNEPDDIQSENVELLTDNETDDIQSENRELHTDNEIERES